MEATKAQNLAVGPQGKKYILIYHECSPKRKSDLELQWIQWRNNVIQHFYNLILNIFIWDRFWGLFYGKRNFSPMSMPLAMKVCRGRSGILPNIINFQHELQRSHQLLKSRIKSSQNQSDRRLCRSQSRSRSGDEEKVLTSVGNRIPEIQHVGKTILSL
jgi:hypothetical protein